MIKPEPNIIKSLALATRQYPEILSWLEGVYSHELKRLPYITENPAVFQGRCQMVAELIQFVKDSPAVAAKL